MDKTELRIRRIKDAKELFGYTIKELEIRSELGYATIWRLLHDIGTPRKTTLNILEGILRLDR